MLFRIRRSEPKRAPLGGFGITEAEYDRIAARIRADRNVSTISDVAKSESLFAATTYRRESTTTFTGTYL